MVYVKQRESTIKQMAYAKRILGGQGNTKKEIALDSGYSPYVANSVSSHIENTAGFHNAMTALAKDSNNLALAAMHEFKARGFHDFTNKELVGALNAIGNAWAKFNRQPSDKEKNPTGNRLRTVVLQQIENQNIQVKSEDDIPTSLASTTSAADDKTVPEVVEVGEVDNPLDF